MGVEFGSNSQEIQDKEIQLARECQIEQNEAEHRRLGEVLDNKSTIDNEGERKKANPEADSGRLKEDSSKLENNRSIEDEDFHEQPEMPKPEDTGQHPLETNNEIWYDGNEHPVENTDVQEPQAEKDDPENIISKGSERLNELGNSESLSTSENSDGLEKFEEYKDVREFNDELKNLYSDSKLSNQEKVDAAQTYIDKLNKSDLSPEEKKQSIDVPSDVRALKNPENSDWMEKTDKNPWPPLNIDFPDKMGLDYNKDITPIGKGNNTSQLPDTGYRYGGEGGYNYTCEDENGHIPSLDERAVPKQYVPEKDRTVHFDNNHYCNAIDAIRGFGSDPESSLNSLNSEIDKINSERETDVKHLDADEIEALSDKYMQLQDTEFADVRSELGIDDKNFTAYGVHGYAKPMEDVDGNTICDGGADQFNTALPEYMLKRIGAEY